MLSCAIGFTYTDLDTAMLLAPREIIARPSKIGQLPSRRRERELRTKRTEDLIRSGDVRSVLTGSFFSFCDSHCFGRLRTSHKNRLISNQLLLFEHFCFESVMCLFHYIYLGRCFCFYFVSLLVFSYLTGGAISLRG